MLIPDIKQLNILLLEDSRVAAKKLIKLLEHLDIGQIELADSYRNAVKMFEERTFDVILADIFLGANRKRGDDFIRYIRKRKFTTPVIYLTSFYEEKIYHEVKDTRPKCFLSKELSVLSLRQALELSLWSNHAPTKVQIPRVNVSRFFVKDRTDYKAISLNDIIYFDTKHKITFAHLKDKHYSTNISLKDLEQQLLNFDFVRVHRGYLINLNHVETINTKQSQIIVNGNLIPIGQSYRKQLLERVNLL